MKKGKNKKKVAVLATGLAVLALTAGTFAWTSYTEWTKNHMQSKGFEDGRVTVVEDFKPETPIDNPDPNVATKVKKDVKVGNFSSTDAFVRVSFEEMLHKLENGATKKGYGTSEAAKFPVIVDNTKYYSKTKDGSLLVATADTNGYKDITAQLKVFDKKDGIEQKDANFPKGIKLIVEVDKDGKEIGDPILIAERVMTTSEFPNDFDFAGKTGTVPVIKGAFDSKDSASSATVSQKVTGKLIKQLDGSYQLYTSEAYTNPDDNLSFYGFGVDKGTATDADWAGVNVNVTNAASDPRKGNVEIADPVYAIHSLIDPDIKFNFTKDNVKLDLPAVPTDEWYYNAADGYFYWCNVVKSGATTSKALMNEVEFPAMKDDPTYYITSYNLWVGLESIPAAVEPLKAASNGGALGDSPSVDGTNKTWVSNNSGWDLGNTTARPGTIGANDTKLIELFTKAATIAEIK